MAINSIGVINYSTMASDADVASWLEATQAHMVEVARIWSIPAISRAVISSSSRLFVASSDAWEELLRSSGATAASAGRRNGGPGRKP